VPKAFNLLALSTLDYYAEDWLLLRTLRYSRSEVLMEVFQEIDKLTDQSEPICGQFEEILPDVAEK